jgi:AcrR family transcriptional regulator
MGRPPTIDRKQLLEAARSLFARKGYDATTLAEIAAAVKVTPAAVLRHAGSKEKLFVESMAAGMLQLPPFFAELEAAAVAPDPRVALRRFAEQFVPFAEQRLAETISIHMHVGAKTPFAVPFDPKRKDSPPRRGIPLIERYLERAVAAGTLRLGDPRAASILFAGSLQSYAFFHQVLQVFDRPFPLDAYLDTLFEIWTVGAVVLKAGRKKKTGGKVGGRRGGKAS